MSNSSTPIITRSLIRWLRDQYPPRCYDGSEKLEEHLTYAGKVQLIAVLAELAEVQAERDDAIAALATQELEVLEAEDRAHVHFHATKLGEG